MADDLGNGRRNGQQPVVPKGRIRRTAPMAGFAARTAGERVVAALRARRGDEDAKERFHERTADRYAELLGHSKGVLMKAGQLLSFVDAGSGDAGSPFGIYQSALERLQADAPPMDAATARDVVESELGKSIDEVFASWKAEPIAAASIGQVHEAQLHDGRKVAVKVQYPGVAEAIADDLANTELLATFLQLGASLAPGYTRIRQRPAAREIAERIAEEVDYHHEAANIRAFAALYGGHPFICVPEVIDDVSTPRVLTMTYVEGMPWQDAQHAAQDLKDRWGEIIFRFAVAYRVHGLFNADPHPGNYLFREDGTVGFVDFGCVKQFTEARRCQLTQMFRAAIDQRGDDLRRDLIAMGFLEERTAPPADLLVQWYSLNIESLVGPQPFTYTPEFVSGLIHRVYDPQSEWHEPVTRHFDYPGDLVFLTRIDLGLASVLATLRATANWRAVADELDRIIPATTELGKIHAEWAASRQVEATS